MLVTCDVCNGSGRDQRESTYGDCPICQGTGQIDDGFCPCGATVILTDSEGCIFCGGFTVKQRGGL